MNIEMTVTLYQTKEGAWAKKEWEGVGEKER